MAIYYVPSSHILARKRGHNLSHNFHAGANTSMAIMAFWRLFLHPVGVMYRAHSSPCTRIWCGVCMYADLCEARVCVLFVSSTSGVFFNPSATTDPSQPVKDTDPYLKSQLYVEDLVHQKPVLILPNGLSKPGEPAQAEINFWQQPLDR